MGGFESMTLDDILDVNVGDGPIEVDIRRPKEPAPQPQDELAMQPYNPFASKAPMQSWDYYTMDRMLTIKRPQHHIGEIWMTEAGFAETLSLLHLNKHQHEKYWREFRTIQFLAKGELSYDIVEMKQEALFWELVSHKSVIDVTETGNLAERDAWITNTQRIEQTLRTPPSKQPAGFVGTLIDGISRR